MPVTQKDIAKALNVSQGLVAQVLGNRKDARATDETRERIVQMARQMDYRPNTAARTLRSGRTWTVLFAYLRPMDDNIRHWHAMIVETLAESLGADGYSLQVRAFTKTQSLLDSLADAATTRVCDLVVLIGSDEIVMEQGHLLDRLNMPFAVIGRYETLHPEWLQVDFDHEGMMEGAVMHLYNLGHRRIAFFFHDNMDTYNLCLRKGFIEAVKSRKDLVFRDDYICQTGTQSPHPSEQILAWLALLESERPTAAVIATGDRTWMHVEMTLAQAGIRVGEAQDEFTLTGITADRNPLVLGTAHAYKEPQMSIGHVTHALVKKLLMPRLRGEDISNPILRMLPTMDAIEPCNVQGLTAAVDEFINRNST